MYNIHIIILGTTTTSYALPQLSAGHLYHTMRDIQSKSLKVIYTFILIQKWLGRNYPFYYIFLFSIFHKIKLLQVGLEVFLIDWKMPYPPA